jgi:hypothetical protein
VAWEADGQGGQFVKLVRPPDDDSESWSQLVDSMSAEIRLIKQARLRDLVDELFQHLVVSAVFRFDRPLPSQADLSRRLGIPTSTVAESYRRLREIVEKFRPRANPR